MPLSEPVSFYVKQKLTRVLRVFHATPVSVTITDRFYATGPWFDWHVAWVPFIRGLGTALAALNTMSARFHFYWGVTLIYLLRNKY